MLQRLTPALTEPQIRCCTTETLYSANGITQGCNAQAEVGEVVLGALLLADFLIGMYVVVLDELVKEWRLVRTKPYQMELDDALALTDEDALAKDMSALRAGRAEGRSYYMEVTCLPTSTCLPNVYLMFIPRGAQVVNTGLGLVVICRYPNQSVLQHEIYHTVCSRQVKTYKAAFDLAALVGKAYSSSS